MLTHEMLQSPFMAQLDNEETQKMALFNLVCSKRDLKLWTSIKMKPTRSWKVSDAKKYFGIKGSGDKLMEEFMTVFDAVWPLVTGQNKPVESQQ